jgi:hypothetical protein
MNDLKSFAALQSRLYEFLAQQDEATLQGIAAGTVRLAVVSDSDVQAPMSPATREPAPIAPQPGPSTDPYKAAHDLPKLETEHDRQLYLTASGFKLAQLKQVAKLLGLTRYSGLTKAELTAAIAGHHQNRTSPRTVEQDIPRLPAREVIDDSGGEERAIVTERPPTPIARSAEPTTHDADVAAIATRLRNIETEDEGAAYLRAQSLDRDGLLAVAAELQLTRVDRLKPAELEKRVLKQAIGARRKFAGLRKW